MKKNYIAPNTEMLNFASMGLMQAPVISMAAGSPNAGTGAPTTDNMDFID